MLTSILLPLLVVLPATLGFADKAVHENYRSRARAHYAKRVKAESEAALAKRASYRMTFYDVGLGACGGYK